MMKPLRDEVDLLIAGLKIERESRDISKGCGESYSYGRLAVYAVMLCGDDDKQRRYAKKAIKNLIELGAKQGALTL